MADLLNRENIHRAIDSGFSALRGDPMLAQRVLLEHRKEKNVKMRKKYIAAIIIAAALLMTTVAVAAALSNFEAVQAAWRDSFQRMNTSGAIDIYDRGEFDLETFEAEYNALRAEHDIQMGNEPEAFYRKDDLVISTVPDETRLGYDAAYAIARSAILDTFGTPAEELDAMGVYPEYFEMVYEDDPGEWCFYFTARRDEDISDDHEYEAPGEYRVFINARSGEVTDAFWYTDVIDIDVWFWPEYAQRAWDAGKYDVVYRKALRSYKNDFFKQPAESQERFLKLFEDAGYDADAVRQAADR